MKIRLTGLFCVLIALCMLASLAACASGKGGEGTQAASAPETEAVSPESSEAATEADTGFYRNVDKTLNFGGDEFTVLSYDANTWNVYITAEENTGVTLNDAAYTRNCEVEDLLGIKIVTKLFPQTQLVSKIQAANADGGSGGEAYDLVCFWATTNLSNLITTNAVEDWTKLDCVNLSEPWYNQSANRAFNIAGKQYVAVSDFTYTVQQHFRFLCNLEMLNDLGLEKPYALVDSGDWTLEALMRYIKDVYANLDDDPAKTAGDRYGLAITYNGTSRFINNWDASPARTTDEGFAVELSGERLQSMVEAMNALHQSPDTWTVSGVDYTVFNEGRALFEVYSSDPDMLREIAFDYAYLPYPKFNKDQQNYITVTHGGTMAVPACSTDLSRAGAVIEALSAASSKYLKDAFIESYFNSRVLRDADSVRMYKLMRETAYFDVSRYIDPSGKLSGLSYYTDLLKKNDSNLPRQYQNAGKAIERGYKDFWDGLKGN